MALEFEWDDRKARANVRKHGVRFETVRNAFRDPFAVEWEDRDHDAHEVRFILLGQSAGRIYVVVYTLRGDVIRLISARPALAFERRLYHDNTQN